MVKRPSRWLALLTLLASAAVAAAGVVPHGDDDQSCLVCKVRQQPLQTQAEILALEGPPASTFRTILFESFTLPSVALAFTSPRAPPV